jgi:hypothetical protein
MHVVLRSRDVVAVRCGSRGFSYTWVALAESLLGKFTKSSTRFEALQGRGDRNVVSLESGEIDGAQRQGRQRSPQTAGAVRGLAQFIGMACASEQRLGKIQSNSRTCLSRFVVDALSTATFRPHT